MEVAVCASINARCSRQTADLSARRANHQKPVQPRFEKYFPFAVGQNTFIRWRYPIPKEGRIAIVTDAGWDAVDAAAARTYVANADGEVVWS